VAEEMASLGETSLHNIADFDLNRTAEFDLVVLGSSTWGLGEMQSDWEGKENLPGVNLAGKNLAVFGLGDQTNFPDTFVDAMGILADAGEKAGGRLVGKWSVSGYEFSQSLARRGDQLAGLALDEDNQSALTAQRIVQWVAQIKKELA
jgi:flavodoxin I